MDLEKKYLKYKYKFKNCNDDDKKNIYKYKYKQYSKILFQQNGSGIFDIQKEYTKRSICAKKDFNNEKIIKEIYENDLLYKLHLLILETVGKEQTEQKDKT